LELPFLPENLNQQIKAKSGYREVALPKLNKAKKYASHVVEFQKLFKNGLFNLLRKLSYKYCNS